MTTKGTDNTTLAEPTTLSTETNTTAAAEVLPKSKVMVPATKMDTGAQRDQMNPWAASPAMARTWIIPTTGLGDQPVSSMPSYQVRGEEPYILTVTTTIGRLNLEATGVTPVML